MERTVWTDERLDERMKAIDETFEQIFIELRALRAEMTKLRTDVTAIMATLSIALVGVLGAGQF